MEEIRTRKNEIIQLITELGERIETLKRENAELERSLEACRADAEATRRALADAEAERVSLGARIDAQMRETENLRAELAASKQSFEEIFGALQDVNRTVRKMAME